MGTGCVFLAKMAGATVIACASSDEKIKRLYALGADHVIDYARGDFMTEVHARFGKPPGGTSTGGVDVVVNFTGGDTWVPSLPCLRRGGRLLTCGATASFDPQTDIRYIWTFELQILGSNGWTPEDLDDAAAHGRRAPPAPVIDRMLPLTEAREGIRLARRP